MDIRKIRKLIELINQTGIAEIEVKEGEESVRIARQSGQPVSYATPAIPAETVTPTPAHPPAAEEPAETEKQEELAGHVIRSPMVGAVYLAPSPEAQAFTGVGERIEKGDTLCLVEAMKMFNPVEADVSGTVIQCLVEDGQPVEFDQPLFTIKEE